MDFPEADVQRAVQGWSCDVCKAKRGQSCVNKIRPGEPLPGRPIHLARLVDRRREPKDEE